MARARPKIEQKRGATMRPASVHSVSESASPVPRAPQNRRTHTLSRRDVEHTQRAPLPVQLPRQRSRPSSRQSTHSEPPPRLAGRKSPRQRSGTVGLSELHFPHKEPPPDCVHGLMATDVQLDAIASEMTLVRGTVTGMLRDAVENRDETRAGCGNQIPLFACGAPLPTHPT